MMKKNWEMPKTVVQRFEPNEYVAACYSVVCNVENANAVEKDWILERPWWQGGPISNYNAGQTHSSSACGAPGNYYVIDDNDDGKFDSMIEISRDLGRLNCEIFTDASYSTGANWGSIASGQTIYWTTQSGDRTWHHQGLVGVADSSHPNRS